MIRGKKMNKGLQKCCQEAALDKLLHQTFYLAWQLPAELGHSLLGVTVLFKKE